MNLQITITNKDEAQDAVNMLNAYLGNSSVSPVAAKAVETKPEKETVEEPKKSSKPETKAKTTSKLKAEEKPESEADEDDEQEENEDEAATESDIDLKALTNIAKEAVERTDRAAAKKVISKYGSKLSEVEESDYAALAKELETLGA